MLGNEFAAAGWRVKETIELLFTLSYKNNQLIELELFQILKKEEKFCLTARRFMEFACGFSLGTSQSKMIN